MQRKGRNSKNPKDFSLTFGYFFKKQGEVFLPPMLVNL